MDYLHAYMRYWNLYEKSNTDSDNKQEDSSNNLIYRYDWLLPSTGGGSILDIETIQDRIVQFVIHKNKQGLSAKAIENYTNHLRKFYRG